MRTIGVRELRHDTAAILRLVSDGETFEITNHGRPVARLVPTLAVSRRSLRSLVDEGKARPPASDRAVWEMEPLPAPDGAPATAQVLDEQRQDRV